MIHIESENFLIVTIVIPKLCDSLFADDSLFDDSVMKHVNAIFLEFYRSLKKEQFLYKWNNAYLFEPDFRFNCSLNIIYTIERNWVYRKIYRNLFDSHKSLESNGISWSRRTLSAQQLQATGFFASYMRSLLTDLLLNAWSNSRAPWLSKIASS